ncbi:MAG: DUF4065 domain-containing protein [Lachnospiraceae bacterium]|nr:DUF4065 domain-containing protein [Lachnospiraceae bacterium]
MAKERTQFCIECRKETGYEIRREKCTYSIRGQEYTLDVFKAVCEECGEEVNLPGLMDSNAKLIDEQYRKIENLVTVEDINTLMEVYNIGKAPLSLALGFGEITITRYLQGQYPSVEYSNIIRKALSDADFMMDCLEENREKVGDTAFKKSWSAAKNLKELVDSVSEKMLITISYIFEKTGEITPLALQKILYYTQGIFMVNYGRPLFREECQAWVHGPVYEEVYDMFKGFKYNPIEDKRFVIFRDRFQMLTDEEKKVIDMVLNSFGMYSGKTLEKIAHKEAPWVDAFDDNNVCGYTNQPITKEAIRDYFELISKDYDLKSEEGLRKYIKKQLG